MSFNDIIGQDQAIGLLQSGIRSSRLAHAYLFAGPDGVGKRMTALTLSKALNCHQSSVISNQLSVISNKSSVTDHRSPVTDHRLPLDSCDQCSSCRRIDAGNHPDVRLIQPSPDSIKIEQMRVCRREAFLKPFEGARKVYIIDSAELMTPEAANSLLKTLEEPPGEAMFILTTSRVAGLLPTIISRCQLVRFNLISTHKIEDLLANVHGMARDAAHRASCLCEGSVGRALRIGEGLRMARRERLLELVAAMSLSDVGSIFELSRELTEDKEHIPEALNVISSWYRDVLILKESGEVVSIVNSDKMGLLEDEAGRSSTEDLMKAIGVVQKIKEYIKRNVNLRLAIETMLLKIGGLKGD